MPIMQQAAARKGQRTHLECVPRYATARTKRRTYGTDVAELALIMGWRLMPWQRQVLDTALEHGPDNRFCYRTVVVTVPRQQGKTLMLWALMLWRSLAYERQVIIATAQTGSEAQQKWLEYVDYCERSEMGDRIRHIRRANGSQNLEWDTFSAHMVRAPTPRAGHGVTLDLGVIDEAWALRDESVIQSMRPAMITRPNAQLWIVSTAGTLDSVLLRRHVEAGRSAVAEGTNTGLAYFEWSAPEDAPADDPATWRLCMPALGHTISEDVIAQDFHAMTPGERERAYLNRWTETTETVIPLGRWEAVQREDAAPGTGLGVWLGADMTPERDASCIVACGKNGDDVCLEVIEHGANTDWLAPRINELIKRHKLAGVVLDAGGPAAGIADQLNEPPVLLNYRQVQQASGAFFDAIMQGTINVRPSLSLDSAVRGAAQLGSGDVWRWGRKRSSGDVCPLMAATLALWQLRQDRGGTLTVW